MRPVASRPIRVWSRLHPLGRQTRPQVRQTAVDEILGPLECPIQEARRFGNGVTLQMECDGKTPLLLHRPETSADASTDLPRRRCAFGVLPGARDHHGVLLEIGLPAATP